MRVSRMIINYVRIESICETLKVAVKVNTKKLRLSWFKCVQCRFCVGKYWRQAEKKKKNQQRKTPWPQTSQRIG